MLARGRRKLPGSFISDIVQPELRFGVQSVRRRVRTDVNHARAIRRNLRIAGAAKSVYQLSRCQAESQLRTPFQTDLIPADYHARPVHPNSRFLPDHAAADRGLALRAG